MKLKTLKLKNFRQFYGDQKLIYFPDSEDKNVTLIFGANGAGKTAILNAFTWALYKKTTPALANPNKIICERAILEAKENDTIEANVQLKFEHDDKIYIVNRTRKEKKIGKHLKTSIQEDGLLELKVIDEAGETEVAHNPSDRLDKVLPERLHNFFFFDGERIERIAQESAYQEIEDAIKNILGLTILERAVIHLEGAVKRKLDNELSEVGNQQTKEIIEQIQKFEKEKNKLQEDLKNEDKNKNSTLKFIEEVKTRLRQLDETRFYQMKLDELEQEAKQIQEKLHKNKEKIRRKVTRNGYAAFVDPLINECKKIFEDKRKRGQLPSGIKKAFVSDLLDAKSCICGSSLDKGTEKREKVEEWLKKAGQNDVEEGAMRINAHIEDMQERKRNLFIDLKNIQIEQEKQRKNWEQTKEKISEYKHKLGERESEEIKELIDKRDKLERNVQQISENIGSYKKELEDKDKDLADLEKEKENTEAENKKADIIKRKINICKEASNFFNLVYESKSESIRIKLDQRVKNVYQKISFKSYWPVITSDFQLKLKKGISDENEEISSSVAKSTGENQILSLSFIGSVSDYARQLYQEAQKDELLDFHGGIYPIIMDSPFGNLDENYKRSVAEGLPSFANQVCIIVSKSQGTGIVLEKLKQFVDHIYIISYYTPKEDYKNEYFKYEGEDFKYITLSENNKEWANIVEVN